MKKCLTVFTVLCFVVTSLVFAAQETPNRDRERKQIQICTKVLEGEPVVLTGDVVSLGDRQAMVVETAEGTVTIYGIGPVWYWEANSMDRPEFGEEVTVEAFAIPFEDGIRYVAASIAVEDQPPLQLRDETTGCPLWRNRQH